MKGKNTYYAIGLMSGTSLDGLDIAYGRFTKTGRWAFKVIDAVTISYSTYWKSKLIEAPFLSGEDLLALHSAYGAFVGGECRKFIRKRGIRAVDLIASHGHTIFHQTERRFTFQLGDGNAIHAVTGLPVVFDFRSLDVALGGQGAPLVPVGDRHLFGQYDVCLNLGGIANLSMEKSNGRVAFDICFANMALNFLASKIDLGFDRNGTLASRGSVNEALLESLTDAYRPLYKKRPALGREGFETAIQPLLESESIAIEDRLRTVCESIAREVRRALPPSRKQLRILTTGGGALNGFLVTCIQRQAGNARVEIPAREIIEFKEALVFALLGVLRLRGEINVLKSVTRASADSCSGVIAGDK